MYGADVDAGVFAVAVGAAFLLTVGLTRLLS